MWIRVLTSLVEFSWILEYLWFSIISGLSTSSTIWHSNKLLGFRMPTTWRYIPWGMAPFPGFQWPPRDFYKPSFATQCILAGHSKFICMPNLLLWIWDMEIFEKYGDGLMLAVWNPGTDRCTYIHIKGKSWVIYHLRYIWIIKKWLYYGQNEG